MNQTASKLTALNAHGRRTVLLISLFVAGWILSRLFVTAPIHELCHVVAAWLTGGGGRLVSWAYCETWGRQGFDFVRFAGFYGEMILYLLFCGLATIRKYRAGGLFWFGCAHGTYFFARNGADFEVWEGLSYNPEVAHAVTVFYVIFGLLLAVGWILFIGREYQYRLEIQSYLKPEPKRRLIEKIRRKWG